MRYLMTILLLIPMVVHANPACSSKEHRAFDFWLGKWQVTTSADKVIRHNHISLINNGCTLLEEYSTPSGYLGKSLNIYDSSSKQWYQTWTDSSGYLLQLSGGMVDGSMVMTGTSFVKQQTVLQKITWTPKANGTVRQHWQSSSDNGKSWQTVFDGIYTKT